MTSETTVKTEVFAGLVPLNALRSESQSDLARKASIALRKAGDYLFKVGEPARQALYVLSGEVHLEDAQGKAIARVRGGEASASHRVAHQSPRRVAARCVTDSRILVLDAALLDVMLTWDQTGSFEVQEISAASAADDWMTRLLQMRTFQLVPPANLQAMFLRMSPLVVEPGQVIVKQGAEGDYFYVVMEGRCIVTREQPGMKPVRLAELEPGACFGEEALISDSVRNATITMLTRGRLMRLAKQDFRTLLNEPLARKISLDEARQLVSAGKARWLDVRLPSEFQNQHLPGSLNLPLYMLRMKLAQLDPASRYICVCDSGRRSAVASFVLTQKGFDACALEQGLPAG